MTASNSKFLNIQFRVVLQKLEENMPNIDLMQFSWHLFRLQEADNK